MRDCIDKVMAAWWLEGIRLVVVVVQDDCELMIHGRGKVI